MMTCRASVDLEKIPSLNEVKPPKKKKIGDEAGASKKTKIRKRRDGGTKGK